MRFRRRARFAAPRNAGKTLDLGGQIADQMTEVIDGLGESQQAGTVHCQASHTGEDRGPLLPFLFAPPFLEHFFDFLLLLMAAMRFAGRELDTFGRGGGGGGVSSTGMEGAGSASSGSGIF